MACTAFCVLGDAPHKPAALAGVTTSAPSAITKDICQASDLSHHFWLDSLLLLQTFSVVHHLSLGTKSEIKALELCVTHF